MAKGTKKRIVRRKTARLLGHANFLLPPEQQAAMELHTAKVGESSTARLYQRAVAEFIEREKIVIPTPAQVAEHFGAEWVKKNSYQIGGDAK